MRRAAGTRASRPRVGLRATPTGRARPRTATRAARDPAEAGSVTTAPETTSATWRGAGRSDASRRPPRPAATVAVRPRRTRRTRRGRWCRCGRAPGLRPRWLGQGGDVTRAAAGFDLTEDGTGGVAGFFLDSHAHGVRTGVEQALPLVLRSGRPEARLSRLPACVDHLPQPPREEGDRNRAPPRERSPAPVARRPAPGPRSGRCAPPSPAVPARPNPPGKTRTRTRARPPEPCRPRSRGRGVVRQSGRITGRTAGHGHGVSGPGWPPRTLKGSRA